MKNRKLTSFMLLLVFAFSVNLIGDVLINEFDTSTSSAEYIELYNPTDAAIDLSAGQYVLVFVNGADETIYQATDLTGTIAANGYYVVAEAEVTDIEGYTPDQNATWTSFQNGADGIALVKGETAANLSSGDYATTLAASAGTQIDAIIYGGIGVDAEINTAFGTADINITISYDGSSSRITDGQGDAAPNYANSDWTIQARTPGVTNVLPLSITSAVSISLTEIEIKYTVDVSAVDVADYSVLGTAGINFTTADIDPDDPSIVILTADADIVGDTVLDTLVDAACSDSVVLYIGITPIALLNTANPSGTIENGYLASFEGIVSANDGYNNVWVSDSDGAYNGAFIYDYDFDLAADVGDEIVFSAERAVYNNLTELKNPVLIETISTGNVPYGPDLIAGADIDTSLAADTDPAEQYEGQLVKIEGALVESYTDYQYICTDDGGATHFMVGDEVDYHFGNISMTVGETYDIIGVVDYKNKYRLNPRDVDDITSLTVASATDYTIAEIQDTTGTGSADSPKVGELVRTTGIVTGVFSGKYTLQDGNGGFSGIWVDDDLTVTVGDEVTVKGLVSESYNLTIITADSSGVNSSGNLLPEAEALATGDVSAEEWEGVLVTVTGACDNADLGYGEWSVDDGSGSVRMDDLAYAFTPTAGTEYTITGPVYYSYSNFKIIPRDADDIVESIQVEGTVVINEVGEPYTMAGEWADSYIELYNTTDAAIDVGGWVVWSVDASSKGTSSIEIPTGVQIAANGYLIVTRDRTTFLNDYGSYVDSNIVVNSTTITGTGVYIADSYYFELKDAAGTTIDKTTEAISWNSTVYEKSDPSADGLNTDSWHVTYQTSPVEGTPGAVNSIAPAATDYTISEIQDTTGTGSADSPKVGEMVRTTGIVTGVFSGKYTLQDGNGGFCGIWVDDDLTVTVGDEVTVKGLVSESYNLTIITADSSGVNSSGNLLPEAEALATGDVSVEEWEGVLVTVTGTCDNADLGYGEWSVDDGSGSVRMDDLAYAFTPTAGTEYTITGPVYYSYSNFKIVPRDADDINAPPEPFTMIQPTDGYTIDDNDVVQDSMIQVVWTEALDPDGDAVNYELFILDATADTVVLSFELPDTSILIDAPAYEDNGIYKIYVLAFDPYGAFSSSDTITITIDMQNPDGIDGEIGLPKTFALHQNYPNPFNPITTIKYDLPQESHVKIMIYDIMGREVRTLVNARQQAGYQAIQWNALDNNGRRVSSGYYICVMQADKYHKIQKMILLK